MKKASIHAKLGQQKQIFVQKFLSEIAYRSDGPLGLTDVVVVAKFENYCTEFAEESCSASFDGKGKSNKRVMYRAMRVAEYLQEKY